MVNFEETVLSNGIKVIIDQNKKSPLAAVTIVFTAGSKNDPSDKKGIAHLLEHMLFTGTSSIPDYDDFIQHAGGDSNAATYPDYALFYGTVPPENLVGYLEMERDRFDNILFTKSKFEIQKNVVIEEYNENVRLEPYGDCWHHILESLFENHYYSHPVIGKDETGIQNITLADLKGFYEKHYKKGLPIISVSSPYGVEMIVEILESIFGSTKGKYTNLSHAISNGKYNSFVKIKSKEDLDHFFMVWKIGERFCDQFYKTEMIVDLLNGGYSGKLELLVNQDSDIWEADAYTSEHIDEVLFIIEVKCSKGYSQISQKRILDIFTELKSTLSDSDLDKIKNQAETDHLYNELYSLDRSMTMAFFKTYDKTQLINSELKIYTEKSLEDIKTMASFFRKNAPFVLQYS
jgi:predicted Zn-dependent peptidase